jgi:TonB family protein
MSIRQTIRRIPAQASTICLLLLMSCLAAGAQDTSNQSRKNVRRVEAVVPDVAIKNKLGGTVRIEAVVDRSGKVKSTRVLGGHPILAHAAVEALRRWQYASAPKETTEVVEFQF